MNTTTQRLARLTTIFATLAAAVAVLPAQAAEVGVRIVQLAPVVVTAKRIRVVELAPVIVTAKRDVSGPTMLAQRSNRASSSQSAGRG